MDRNQGNSKNRYWIAIPVGIISLLIGIFSAVYGFTYAKLGIVEVKVNQSCADIQTIKSEQARYKEDIVEIKLILSELRTAIINKDRINSTTNFER